MRRLGCIVSVVLAGAFFAISISNFHTALQRSRQKRTMAHMHWIAEAFDARAKETGSYAIGTVRPCGPDCAFASMTPVALDALERNLEPKYIKEMQHLDGWGKTLEVRVSATSYVIRARGSDGRFDADVYPAHHAAKSFDADIVLRNGEWQQYPEGLCH